MTDIEVLRPDQEALLQEIGNEKAAQRGHLKIFFGYAAGAGKTYAMLKAAHNAKQSGIDVVAGYVEPRGRPATAALLDGLEHIPVMKQVQSGHGAGEFDLDAALSRHPELLLVDELAHINAAGSRCAKRCQDIEELLDAGIDVYTTVDVRHIESLKDKVDSITGALGSERLADFIFDSAYQVEFVDIEPEELLRRLKEENACKDGQTEQAALSLPALESLTALRELALYRCAGRMKFLEESARIKKRDSHHLDEHILVCLSPAPSNAKIVRAAARMAAAFQGNLTALFVETPSFAAMCEEDKKRLCSNKRLAEQLGASIEIVYGEDVPYQISEYARLSGVSKIVIGRSSAKRSYFWGSPTLTERLADAAPDLELHIIPDVSASGFYRVEKVKERPDFSVSLLDTLKSTLILLLSTLVGFAFSKFGFTEANIITIYILGVLITSVVTKTRIYSLISSIISVFVFNFFFTVPRFTFSASDKDYPVTFAIMFIVALLTRSLAVKLKTQARQSAQSAFRTKVLFDTNQLLQKARSDNEIVTVTANQLIKLLNRDVVVYPVKDGALSDPRVFSDDPESQDLISEDEKRVAAWVLQNKRHAGITTNTMGSAKCLYLPVRLDDAVYGIVGIHIDSIPLDSFENSVLMSILGECALALENSRNAREKEQAAVLAKNEQLRANLLRTISHDLRTPLTSISGNASNLLSNSAGFDENTKKQIYTDIYDDSMWLINLVENLLSITRIEEGKINLRLSTELMDEVVTEALRHINRKSVEHCITVESSSDFVLAKMDAKLIVQVIINLVNNAVKYTPAGSNISIRIQKEHSFVTVSVADDGFGISDEVKSHVFDMFFSGADKVADSRRSLGLGLSLCKSIITAHGGEITVRDNAPQGAVFSFTLPAGEVEIHE